jgi:HSP20 family molecular chaperone IbpA
MDVPGIKAEDLGIQLENDMLTCAGERALRGRVWRRKAVSAIPRRHRRRRQERPT